MNKKTLLVLLPVILISCSNPSNTIDNINTEKNLQPETVKPTQVLASVNPEEKIVKSYTINDINNNFVLADNVEILYNFSGKINDKGNGLIILRGYAVKIVNFKPSGEKKVFNNDVGNTELEIDENGDGILSWIPPPSVSLAFYSDKSKYKKVKNFDILDETYDTYPSGSQFTDKNEKETNLIKSVNGDKSLQIDKSGNGIIIKNDSYSNFFRISTVKNFIIENNEYILSPEKELLNKYASNIQSQIDKDGNGFISWEYQYPTNLEGLNTNRSEIAIKKLENYIPVGNEINLGSDYSGGIITLDKKGTGFITWQKEFNPSFSRIRKINNYIPENMAYELSLNKSNPNSFSFRSNLSILKNSYGDGLVMWQEVKDDSRATSFYARAFENYNISTQNLKEYLPVPPPYSSLGNSWASIYTKDGRAVEVANIRGIVYDKDKNIITDADIKVTSLTEPSVEIYVQKSESPVYMISSIPLGEIEITISKAGYKTRSRRVTVISGRNYGIFQGLNKFNFSGAADIDKNYFLEKE